MVRYEQVPKGSEVFVLAKRGIFMIKLQDFARECGVTDRAIQKHLNTYAEELEGLYQRKGPNGTWLTEEACAFLRSKMRHQPVVVGDSEIYRKNEELQQKVEILQEKLIQAHETIDAQHLMLDQSKANQLLLHAAEEQVQKITADLATANQDLGAAYQENENLKTINKRQADDLAEAKTAIKEEHEEVLRLRAELDDRKRHPWRYLFKKSDN